MENNLHQHFGGFLLKNKKNNMKNKHAQELGRKGGKARWKGILKEDRSEAMRKVALERYKNKLTDSK